MQLSAGEHRAFEDLVARLHERDDRERARRTLWLAVVGGVIDIVLVVATLGRSVVLAAASYVLLLASALIAERSLRVLRPEWWNRQEQPGEVTPPAR